MTGETFYWRNIMEMLSFHSHIGNLEDPRQDYKIECPLGEIMLLSLCAEIAGREMFVDISLYGRSKLEFLHVIFRDDDCRVRENDGPMNFSIIKHMAISFFKRARHKTSMKGMRKQAARDGAIMRKVLSD